MSLHAERQDRRALELLPDIELVRRICAGESALFELIMRRYNRRLFRLARGILGNDADAEDVLQDTYVSAYFKLQQFRGPDGFATWLCRIATNEALMRRRRQRRPELTAVGASDALGGSDAQPGEQHHGGSAEDPESELYSLQLQRLLERAVDDLPDVYRPAFVMREIAQLSAAETAQSLGVEEATVKTRVHRARRLLQKQLSIELQAALGDVYRFDGARCDRIIARVFEQIASVAS